MVYCDIIFIDDTRAGSVRNSVRLVCEQWLCHAVCDAAQDFVERVLGYCLKKTKEVGK